MPGQAIKEKLLTFATYGNCCQWDPEYRKVTFGELLWSCKKLRSDAE